MEWLKEEDTMSWELRDREDSREKKNPGGYPFWTEKEKGSGVEYNFSLFLFLVFADWLIDTLRSSLKIKEKRSGLRSTFLSFLSFPRNGQMGILLLSHDDDDR